MNKEQVEVKSISEIDLRWIVALLACFAITEKDK